MPKNIIVCLDGTWNNSISSTIQSTNIDVLYHNLDREGQIQLYHPGVGSHVGAMGTLLDGITGRGVFVAARFAWKFISGNFAAGDKLFIFGFSRGAFAARHLAGMIVRYGLSGHRGTIEHDFRQWLNAVHTPCITPQQPVHFLGLFDCVPGNSLYILRDRSSYLNIPTLEPGIMHFRHAVSSHERRWSFRPLLFSPSPHISTFKQCWFPGYHSDVGGGHGISVGLARFALWWMMREAYAQGLNLAHISCPHSQRPELGFISSCDPYAAPVKSDYWTTRLGLRWQRDKRALIIPECTPVFKDLVYCPRQGCGQEMFDLFNTAMGINWLRDKGICSQDIVPSDGRDPRLM